MFPEEATNPEMQHPLEVGIESLIVQNSEMTDILQESNLLLQSIAIDSNNNDLERSLELQMLQSADNHKETLSALKELKPALSEAIASIPIADKPDFTETNTLLSTMIEEIKKKEDEEESEIEIEIDEPTRSRLRGDKGEKGDRGERGMTGKSGRDGIDGIDGKIGKTGKSGSPDTASDIKGKLESLEGDERLDAKAIKGLDKLEKKVKGIERIQDNYVFGANESDPIFTKWLADTPPIYSEVDTLQSVTDRGSTTTNVITSTAQPTFTYTLGVLTSIAYSNGTTKAMTYNLDGTMNTLTITYPSSTPIVKTFNWLSGVLQSITVA